jgi:nitrilase
MNSTLTVGLAQIAPVWLNRKATTEKMLTYITDAASKGCELVSFGETILPGYPFWLSLTDGATFNSKRQKEIFSYYAGQAVSVEAGDLEPFLQIAKEKRIAIIFGFVERPTDRGGHSLYCSLVNIDVNGKIRYIHRKVMPTYEERLVWGIGDGHGLQVSTQNGFTIGALNCWENWMPLIRSALYAQGEDLHIALWPGSIRNTSQINTFIAQESRSFVISVSGLLHKKDIVSAIPYADEILENSPEWLADGGSCISRPNGNWLVEPLIKEEKLIVQTINHQEVMEERQNLDLSGHYSRPDIVQLQVNRNRNQIAVFKEDEKLS